MYIKVEIEKILASNLQRLRERLDITQAELAERAGLSITAVAHYETGRRWPRIEKVRALAGALGAPEEELFYAPTKTRPTPLEALEVVREALEQALTRRSEVLDVSDLGPKERERVAHLINTYRKASTVPKADGGERA